MESGVYRILNKNNGKCYIGCSIDIKRRWTQHLKLLRRGNHHNDHLQKSWNMYGRESFIFEIIYYCIPKFLYEKEIHFITHYKSYDKNIGYNNTFGGESGLLTQESIEKLSKSAKERWSNLDFKDKMKSIMKDVWNDSNLKKDRVKKIQNNWSNRKFKEIASKERSLRWKDPEYKSRVTKSMRDKWAEPGFREFMAKARSEKRDRMSPEQLSEFNKKKALKSAATKKFQKNVNKGLQNE